MRALSPVNCTVMTTSTVVEALQAVFTDEYAEPQFQNLLITPEFPVTKQEYPSILVNVNIGTVENMGVGHSELFRTPAGTLHRWGHRYFTGTVDMTCYALTTVDRNILADSLINILSFGRWDSSLTPFINTLWGDPADDYSQLAAMYQLELATDNIKGGGNGVGPVPWQTEDELLYSKRISLDFFGGFYSAVTEDLSQFVQRIDIYPHITGDPEPETGFTASSKVWDDTGRIDAIVEISG